MTFASSSSASFSSSSPHNSSTSTHSFSSSESPNSISSTPSFSSSDSFIRCEGLDLLLKAVHHLAGSVVGVPLVQRRVVRRRRRRASALVFNKLIIAQVFKKEDEDEHEDEGEDQVETKGKRRTNEVKAKENSRPKRQRRLMALPSKYQDSVFQPWKWQAR